MADTPIWPVATDAIIADTTDLNDSETCAYVMLMICQWRLNGEGLPDNQEKLQRMSRVEKRKWKKTWANIKHLFRLENGRYFQERVHRDWIETMQKVITNRKNASLGGKAKAANERDAKSLKKKETRLANAKKTLEPKDENANSESLAINKPLTIKKKESIKRKSLPDNFPDAEAKKKAEFYWRSKNVEPDLEAEVLKFRGHHQKNGTVAKSWRGAWQTWYVNAVDYFKQRHPEKEKVATIY